jgi:hypothetical protein
MNEWVPLVGVMSLPVMLVGLICLIRPISKIKIPTRKRAGIVFAGGLGAFILAMSTPYKIIPVAPSPEPTNTPLADTGDMADSDGDLVIPEPTREPLPPQPLYASIDGDDYLYSAGISDDARDAGQVAGQFIAFRYRGVKDGKITLTGEGMTLRCDENCTVITMVDQFGNKQHLEYNPASVAGAAFTDAINGLLVERPSQQKEGSSK